MQSCTVLGRALHHASAVPGCTPTLPTVLHHQRLLSRFHCVVLHPLFSGASKIGACSQQTRRQCLSSCHVSCKRYGGASGSLLARSSTALPGLLAAGCSTVDVMAAHHSLRGYFIGSSYLSPCQQNTLAWGVFAVECTKSANTHRLNTFRFELLHEGHLTRRLEPTGHTVVAVLPVNMMYVYWIVHIPYSPLSCTSQASLAASFNRTC